MADVVIVLDASGDIGDFQAEIAFVSNFILQLNGLDPARISVVTFGDTVNGVIYLNEYNTTEELAQSVLALP